jgi:serine-type D-Ala-D-Ala carboxypeptidase (penicillin-binding protein 5/6)
VSYPSCRRSAHTGSRVVGAQTRGRRWCLVALALLLTLLAACGGTTTARHATGTPPATPTFSPPPASSPPASSPSASTPPTAPTTSTTPPPPAIDARSIYLIDPSAGEVYLARNIDQEIAMASTTKIMTAIVAIAYGQLDATYTVGADAAAYNAFGYSRAGLHAGDRLTLRELLYGLMLPSGDDAAVAVADAVAGSQEAFVSLMNMEAVLLGLTRTHYSNAQGLDAPDHYTTARDLLTLAMFASQSRLFSQIVATPRYFLPATAAHPLYDWKTTNLLLSTLAYPGLTGIKTGFTGNAGYCLVFAARSPFGDLLGVVLGDGGDPARFVDSAALLDWGFRLERAAAQHRVAVPPTNLP